MMELLAIALPILVVGGGTLFTVMNLRRVVPPSEVHIVQGSKGSMTYGTLTDTNSYYEWPSWLPFVGVQVRKLSLSVFDLELNDYEAYDEGKVPFMTDATAFFRIADPTLTAERAASEDELEAQLRSILQGAVRTILAKHDIEEIMMKRSVFGRMFTEETETQLREWGIVNVKNIELMDIRDSGENTTIASIMAKKQSLIEKDSKIEVAENNRAAQVAQIEAQRDVQMQDHAAQEAIGKRDAEKQKNVGIETQKAQQAINTEAATTKDREMDVLKVQEVRTAEINRDVKVVQAEEDKRTSIVRAEGDKQQTVITAEGVLKQQEMDAKGQLAVGEAQAEAARLLEMANVAPQVELAREIGENEGYQTYLIQIRGVERDEKVGIAQADALKAAEIKVIANTGSVGEGVSDASQVLSAQGGTRIGAMLEGLRNTETGSQLLDAVGVKDANGNSNHASA